jgi:hypothetical protein
MASVQIKVTSSDRTPIVSVLEGGLDFDEVVVTHDEYAVKALIPLTILITVPTSVLLTKFVLEPLIDPIAERWKKAVARYFNPTKSFDLTIEITEEQLIIDASVETSHHITAEIWSVVQRAMDVLRTESRLSKTSRIKFVAGESGELLIFSYKQGKPERMIDIEKRRTDKIPDGLMPKASVAELSVEDWVKEQTRKADAYADAHKGYDVVLSFAGEDRSLVEQVAVGLQLRRVRVFYDRFERAELWGKDLYQHLFDVYSSKARYCVVFVSEHYVTKPWTRHEIKAAQAKQFTAESEYILPVRLDDSQLPGLAPTVGYVDARDLNAEGIIQLIMEKLGRTSPILFRGMDLGHDIDPIRSALDKLDPTLFEEICAEILKCFKFSTAGEQAVESSVLARNTPIGKGSIRTGLFHDTFTYVQQLFTELGSGADEAASRMFGEEVFSSEGGDVRQLVGLAKVVIHSVVEKVPAEEDIIAFGTGLKTDSIPNVIFMVNESVYRTMAYFGVVYRTLSELQLNAVILFGEDLAYQVLTTDVYRKYEPRLKWLYTNPL